MDTASELGRWKSATYFGLGALAVCSTILLAVQPPSIPNAPFFTLVAAFLGGVIAAAVFALVPWLSFAAIYGWLRGTSSRARLFVSGCGSAAVALAILFAAKSLHMHGLPIFLEVLIAVFFICVPSVLVPLIALGRR